MKPIIFILADAFRYDYIERYNLKCMNKIIKSDNTQHSTKLFPSTGYCEIIEYFTGQKSNEHGMFSQITARDNWFEIQKKPEFPLLSWIDWELSGIRKIRYFWSKGFNCYLKYRIGFNNANIKYRVPLEILEQFEPTESTFEYDSYDFGGDKNIFVKMKQNGISYDLDDFVKHNKIKGLDKDRFNNLQIKIKEKKLKDFTMIYCSAAEVAHFYGTNDKRTGSSLSDFDYMIGELHESLTREYSGFQLMIVGDHGMIDVKDSVDILSEINKIKVNNKLQLGEDFIFFIDSTVCRLWYRNKDMQNIFESILNEKLQGLYEDDDVTLNYLEQFKPKYGDSIYLIKPGLVYFPDFFNAKPNHGMHGYLSKYEGQQGCMIWSHAKVNLDDEIELSDVSSFIEKAIYG